MSSPKSLIEFDLASTGRTAGHWSWDRERAIRVVDGAQRLGKMLGPLRYVIPSLPGEGIIQVQFVHAGELVPALFAGSDVLGRVGHTAMVAL